MTRYERGAKTIAIDIATEPTDIGATTRHSTLPHHSVWQWLQSAAALGRARESFAT